MDLNDFTERERQLIKAAKRTLTVLAKVMADKDPQQVIKDEDLAEQIGDWTLAEARQDEALARLIDERTTPDLPGLNGTQEALVIGQLGFMILNNLLENE